MVTTILPPGGQGPPPSPEVWDLEDRRTEPSALLQYLPALYEQDPFIGRFLRIFEDIHTPTRRMASDLERYFDPVLAPDALRSTLAAWVGAERSGPLARIPPEAWGRLVREAVELHRWRGTRRGLRRALEIATGHAPLISESDGGMALGDDARLGSNTRLEPAAPFQITVTFECDRNEVDEAVAHAIIRLHRPAHVMHSIAFAGAGAD